MIFSFQACVVRSLQNGCLQGEGGTFYQPCTATGSRPACTKEGWGCRREPSAWQTAQGVDKSKRRTKKLETAMKPRSTKGWQGHEKAGNREKGQRGLKDCIYC